MPISKNKHIKSFLIIILFFIFSSLHTISNIVNIDDDFYKKEIIDELQFFVDKDNEFSIKDLISTDFDALFLNYSDQIPYFGFKKITVWVRIKVYSSSYTRKKIVIRYNNPLINSITFYDNISLGSYKIKSLGISEPSSHYLQSDNRIVFETELMPNQTKTLYFRLQNKGLDFALPFTIVEHNEYQKLQSISNYRYGLFYGILIFIVIINLFFYINLTHRIYLYYIFYILAIGLFLLCRDGFLNKYIWKSCTICSEQTTYFLAILPIIFLLIFTQVALRTKHYLYKLHKTINYLIIVICTICLVSIFLKEPIYILCNIIALTSIAPVIIISYNALNIRQLTLPIYFFLGLIFVITGALMMIFKNLGYLPYHIGEIGLKAGLLIQMLFLSFGLTSMYKQILKTTNSEAIENLKKLNKVKDQINTELEGKVQARTQELNKKNKELEIANKQLGAERDIFETQRNLISQQKKETTDSIRYAQRIQRTLIPSEDKFKTNFRDFFILELPKDIVSGDFYWVEDFEDETIIAVADCTGHGVPGAFMSIIGVTFLNEIVTFHKIRKPAEILNLLREKIIQAFTHTHENNGDTPKDGMDICLISINKKNNILEYAGALNPLYIIRKNELITIKPDRMPISIHEHSHIPFTNNVFKLSTEDCIYMFTDGYMDQFGWRSGKKYKYKQFKELLLDINELPAEAKKIILLNSFKNWKGDLEQIDDILIIGINI